MSSPRRRAESSGGSRAAGVVTLDRGDAACVEGLRVARADFGEVGADRGRGR
jgi:hypothetical protein